MALVLARPNLRVEKHVATRIHAAAAREGLEQSATE